MAPDKQCTCLFSWADNGTTTAGESNIVPSCPFHAPVSTGYSESEMAGPVKPKRKEWEDWNSRFRR